MLSFSPKSSSDQPMYFLLLWIVFSVLDFVLWGHSAKGGRRYSFCGVSGCSSLRVAGSVKVWHNPGEFFALRARVDFRSGHLAIHS
jgi:hypothetical protein